MNKKIAFWPYDLYPYTLYGEIDQSKKDGHYIPSYQGYFKPFMVLAEEEAAPIIKRLKELNNNYNTKIANVKRQYNTAPKDLIPKH